CERGLWEYSHNTTILWAGFVVYGYACVPPTPFMLKDWERYDVSRHVDPGCVSLEEGFRSVPVSPSEIRFGTSQARKISLRADANVGKFYDGNRIGFRAEPNFNLSSSLQLSAGYEFNAIRFPERETNNSLNIHSLNMKALYMLSTKLSASLFVQYVNTEDELITNFRLRYNPREGNDFYLVFNDFRGISDRYFIPERPKFFNKTIMVKYTHTFIL
ncbi:MAG: hypothetical protein NTY95_15760, partial [Bacteroidia bacterium]|nr:hypothetical protein [Bacteroidia bacterium]